MAIFLPDRLAVHDVCDGTILWQAEHEIHCCYWLFITKYVTGYLSSEKTHGFEITLYEWEANY